MCLLALWDGCCGGGRFLFGNCDKSYGQTNDFATATPGTSESTLKNPEGLAFDSLGNLYVNDFNNNRIVVYAPGNNSAAFRVYGQGLFTTDTTGVALAPLGLNLPRGIAVDSADNHNLPLCTVSVFAEAVLHLVQLLSPTLVHDHYVLNFGGMVTCAMIGKEVVPVSGVTLTNYRMRSAVR